MSKRREIEANLAVLGNILVAATVLYTILHIIRNEPLKAGANVSGKPAKQSR